LDIITFEAPPKDEYPHDPASKPDWKESWYFQFYDPAAKLCGLFYISSYPNVPKQDFLVAFLTGGEADIYLNSLPLAGKIDTLSDGKLSFQLVEPNHQWNISFDDGTRLAALEFHGRFPTFTYDPQQSFVDGVLEQEHYEQPCTVKGTIRLKGGTLLNIDCLGHRDHSWGSRDYASIDEWYWVAAQFEWCTIGLIRLTIGDKTETAGFMATSKGTKQLTDIEADTRYEDDGITPQGFTYKFKDAEGESWLLKSAKIQTMMYPPRQSKPGYQTNIYEVVSHFMLKKYPDSGYGIAEHLVTRQIR
jgi:hypothetical protein